MTRPFWTDTHADFLNDLMAREDLSAREMSVRMSQHFKVRITPSQVNALLQRMRKHDDPLFRNVPYRRPGVRRI